MQSEKMQVQLCPQLASIQTQLKTAIANHQMVFGSYQKDPENGVLRDKLEEMQVQIKNLSNHQKVLVQQLRGELMHNACAAAAVSAAPTPVVLPATSVTGVAKPLGAMGTLSQRPQLLALPPHPSVGIVVPLAHVQAQPTLMTLPGILSQPMAPTLQSQPLVSLQLSASSATTAAAILTPPTPVCSPPATAAVPKQNQAAAPMSAAVLQLSQSVLQPIQPRRTSPPIKVPHYTVNCHPTAQGQHGGAVKTEKSNGVIHRSFSESDTKGLKRTLDHAAKDARRGADAKHLSPAEKRKQEFMACIGLVTPDALKELQNKRVERKRRSTANPHYSYTLDSEKRRNSCTTTSSNNEWLMGGLASKRPRGRPPKPGPSPSNSRPGTPDSQEACGPDHGTHLEDKRELCAECGKGGQLLLCGTCSLVYHLDCLSPPLVTAPASPWSCPACIVSGKGVGTLSNGALSMVNSYIAAKANKEDERRKLQRKNTDLLHEKQSLQDKARVLKQQIEEKRMRCEKLAEVVGEKSATVDSLNSFVKSFQDPIPPDSST